MVGEQGIVARPLEVVGTERAEGYAVAEQMRRRDQEAVRSGDGGLLAVAAADEVAVLGVELGPANFPGSSCLRPKPLAYRSCAHRPRPAVVSSRTGALALL